MTLTSALEDFMSVTLAAVPGCWGKLRYISDLRQPNGRYAHWGLTRLHGERAVQSALGSAHRAVFLEALKTPLRDLLDDARHSASHQGVELRAYLDLMASQERMLLPRDQGGGCEAHFRSVLSALSALARSRSLGLRPTA